MSDVERALSTVKRLSEEATPGPWLQWENEPWEDGTRVAEIIAPNNAPAALQYPEGSFALPDAALIAAAPDLAASVEKGYTALVKLRDWIREGIGTEADAAEALDDALHDFVARFGAEQ